MKMQPIQTPPAHTLDRFVATVLSAMPRGLNGGAALQSNKHVAEWLYAIRDWLPPELASRGLICYPSGRGVLYQASITDVKPAVIKVAKEAEKKAEKEAAKKETVNPSDWRAVADHIHAAGTLSLLDALQPFAQTPVAQAIMATPSKLPAQLEELGISFDSNTRTYSGL